MTGQLEAIVGQPVTDLMLVAGGSLLLYIGPKRPDSELTEWCLHIDSAWRLDQSGRPIIGSLDSCVETKDEAEPSLSLLRNIQNENIEEVSTGQSVKDITLHLSSGYQLTTFSHSLEGDSWELRCHDGRRVGMAEKNITQLREWQDESNKEKA